MFVLFFVSSVVSHQTQGQEGLVKHCELQDPGIDIRPVPSCLLRILHNLLSTALFPFSSLLSSELEVLGMVLHVFSSQCPWWKTLASL